MSTWYLNYSSGTGQYLFLWWGVENSIMVVSSSVSRFDIGFSAESFYWLITHTALLQHSHQGANLKVFVFRNWYLNWESCHQHWIVESIVRNCIHNVHRRHHRNSIVGLLPVWNPSLSTSHSKCCYLLSQIPSTWSTLQLQHVDANLQRGWSKHSICYSKFWQFVITCNNLWHRCFAYLSRPNISTGKMNCFCRTW